MATHSSILCLENAMDRGTWQVTVHGIAKSQIQLTNTFTVFPTPGAGSGGQYFLNECVCVCLCMDVHTCSQGARPTHHPPQKAGDAPNSLPGPSHSLDAAEACTQRLPPTYGRLGPWVWKPVGWAATWWGMKPFLLLVLLPLQAGSRAASYSLCCGSHCLGSFP